MILKSFSSRCVENQGWGPRMGSETAQKSVALIVVSPVLAFFFGASGTLFGIVATVRLRRVKGEGIHLSG